MNDQLISAVKKDQHLLTEIESYRHQTESFQLWWLGQSGYLLQWHVQRVVIDPYLSDSLTKKYADTGKPHIRMSERVIDPALFKDISVVTSSHNHTDHLDAETLVPILRNNPGAKLLIPEANRQFVTDRLKCDYQFPVGVSDGQSVTIGEFTFHGILAKHNEIERDGNGNSRFLGYVISFGDCRIYHSGDTLWFDGMPETLQRFRPDIAILPINGNDPARQVAGNLDCREAATLGKSINARLVIPCHYDMFTFNTADVDEFIKEARSVDQPFKVMKGGECIVMKC